MAAADHYAIRTLRIPSLVLMENAGSAVADQVQKIAVSDRKKKRALFFCGKGNNGGDGFVAARLLLQADWMVTVVHLESENTLSGDAQIQWNRLTSPQHSNLLIIGYNAFKKRRLGSVDVIVDAMLGTSFRGRLQGKYLSIVQWCNRRHCVKVAVDIPTGLNGATGEVLTDAFKSDVTVTMSNPKTGFYLGQAGRWTGKIVVAAIGIPDSVANRLSLRSRIQGRNNLRMRLIEGRDVAASLPRRPLNSHKHSVGKIFILAGSKSMMGAALLCSDAAMKSGAGQVILGIPETEYPVVAKRTKEVMPVGLRSTNDGTIALSASKEIDLRTAWSDIVVIGCGMSRNSETAELIRRLIRSVKKKVVIDADGLHALIGHLEILKLRKKNSTILTPHLGEFSRLIGVSSVEIETKKIEYASSFARTYNVILVLKGAPTIIADGSGTIIVNDTGNPGMSTAGSGDVLAGVIASMLGQGNSPLTASMNGVYIHGSAGDRAAVTIGQHGMVAGDIITFLPTVIKELTGV